MNLAKPVRAQVLVFSGAVVGSAPALASDMNPIIAFVGFIPAAAILSAIALGVLLSRAPRRFGFVTGVVVGLIGLLNLFGGWIFLEPTHLIEELSAGMLDNEVASVGALCLPVVLSAVLVVKYRSMRRA